MESRLVLSVDTELFTQTPAYRSASGTITGQPELGLGGIEYLLSLFEDQGVTATFFIVSSLAEDHPDVVRQIAQADHEIASHGQTHRLLSELPQADWEAELDASKATLEEITDATVSGFRAPAFARPSGFFTALEAAGYRYDSSVNPSRRIPGWYGGDYANQQPTTADTIEPGAPPELRELPVSVMPRLRLPISGAWTRLLGRSYTYTGIRWLQRRGLTPILYVHPWELVDLPAVDGVPTRVYWRTGAWMRRTLESVTTADNAFVTAEEVANNDD